MDDVYERTADGALRVRLHVQPGARRPGVVGRHGDALRVRVGAPPEGGRANEELLDRLAEALGVPRRALVVERGATSRRKVVVVGSAWAPAAEAHLARLTTG